MSLLKGTPCPACGLPLPAPDEWFNAQKRTRVIPDQVELTRPGCGQKRAVSSDRLITPLLAFAVVLAATFLLLVFGLGFQDALNNPSSWSQFGLLVVVVISATLFVMWAAARFLRLVVVREK
jgi:hypothetical protein